MIAKTIPETWFHICKSDTLITVKGIKHILSFTFGLAEH